MFTRTLIITTNGKQTREVENALQKRNIRYSTKPNPNITNGIEFIVSSKDYDFAYHAICAK